MRTLVILFLAAGCGGSSDCNNGTVLVHATLSGSNLAADTLEVTVSDGETLELVTTVTHRPGDAISSIEVGQYAEGQTRTYTLRALLGQNILAEKSDTFPLTGMCSVLDFTLDSNEVTAQPQALR